MPNSLTGIYDTVTRTKINISSSLLYDWRHVDVNNINTHRAGVIYGGTNIGEKVEFARPGVYKIDGTEPSLQDLLGSRYDIYDSRKASNDLGNKLKEIKKTDIGILVSYDAIGTTKSGGQTTTNLREAFLRVGLVKLSNLRDINFINRQSYAAVFYGTDADNDNSNINSKGYNRDVIERIESEDAWNNNYNAPSASINTILSTDGTYGGIMGAISVNSLWSSNPDYSYPSIITNHRNNLRLKGNINLQYSGAVQISCGSVMTLSLIDTGKILGSGDVNYITRTDLSTQYPYSPNPPIGTFKNFFENQIKSFDIASDLSIFLLNTGKVLTVGLDAFGILGTGTISTDINIITSPVSVSTTGGYNGSNAVAVSSTVSNSLILLNTGKVVGFGSNFSGQLGDASTTTRYEPVAVSTTGTGNDYDGSNAIAIACGDGHSMILLNTGKVLSFGDNDYGQLGDGTIVGKYVPTPVSNTGGYDDTNAIAISTGEVHSMILLNTGKVLSFGDNNYGQLGDGTSGSTNNSSTPTPVSTDSSNGNDYNGSNAIAISCGKNHSMILLNTGKVLSFGDNQNAQLGNGTIGTTNNSDTPTPVSTDSSNGNDYNGSNAIAISTGLLHSMILLNSGKVLSFGRNNFGQLGNGTSGSTNNSSTPVAVSTIGTGNDYNGSNAIGISSRYNSSSILLNTGKVLSFGRNLFGQLGDGSTVDKDEPVAVNSANGYDGSNVKTIYNSFSFNIEGGRYNIEISDFTGYNRYNGKQVSCGNMHSLILLDNGNVFSFGSNRYGQLGIGNTTNSFLPVEVDSQTSDYNGFNAIGISAAAFNSFILLTTGKVVGFGSNYWGQLGDGSTTQRNSPVDVESANGYIKNNAIQISGGVFHSLILLNTGKVLSFGFNSSGQLGDGSTTQRTLPVSVVSANGYVEDNVIQISAGERHSLILLDTGNVLSFGSNQYGQLGNGTSGTINNSNNPVEVDSQNNGFYDGTNAIQVVANFDSSYILLNTGKVLSFGYNQFGELGDRTNTNKSTPTEIDSSNSDYNGSNAISISKSVSTIDNDEPDFYQVKVVKIILNTGQVVSFGGGIVDSDNTIDIRQLPQLDRVYRVTNHADLANVEEYNNGELGDARTYGSDDQFLNINMTSSNVENTPVNIKQSKPANSYSDPGDGLIIEKHSDSSHWIFSIDNDISADYNLNIVNNNGTGISFNSNNAINNPFTFTGQHLNFLNKNIDNNYYGLIVSSTGDYINLNNNLEPNIDESLPICKLTTIENDKKIFGVISDKEDKDRLYSSGIALSIMNKLNNNENRMYINSLGEGAIWVCNKNGNLENGDYISSCSIIGYGAKQIKNENLLSNHTVAKITCDCNFNLTKIIKQKLKLINNFNISINSIKDIDYDDNGDFQYEDDLDDSGNQQLEYQYDTRFLLADATQITKEEYDNKLQLGEEVYIACFVGCTYHCG
jgi:alpha-tubulin suppressor-like RCC1 family protein